jgi:hypothetical protein
MGFDLSSRCNRGGNIRFRRNHGGCRRYCKIVVLLIFGAIPRFSYQRAGEPDVRKRGILLLKGTKRCPLTKVRNVRTRFVRVLLRVANIAVLNAKPWKKTAISNVSAIIPDAKGK